MPSIFDTHFAKQAAVRIAAAKDDTEITPADARALHAHLGKIVAPTPPSIARMPLKQRNDSALLKTPGWCRSWLKFRDHFGGLGSASKPRPTSTRSRRFDVAPVEH
jgi:hypothetical protein